MKKLVFANFKTCSFFNLAGMSGYLNITFKGIDSLRLLVRRKWPARQIFMVIGNDVL